MYKVKGGIVGASDQVVFFSIKPKCTKEELTRIGDKDKKQLGENGILIPREKISGVTALKNKSYTTVIHAKGMADDIGVIAGDEASQTGIVRMVEKLVGSDLREKTKEAGFFAKSGKMVVLSALSAILTALFFILVSGVHPEEVDRVGRHAGKEEFLYSIANTLGPTGTLLLGGAITGLLIYKAFKNSRNGFVIKEYSVQN